MTDVDKEVLNHIEELVAEEHTLRSGTGTDHARLREVEEQLDRCWDLLRQRRARRKFEQDPDGASLRSSQVVEGYRQ